MVSNLSIVLGIVCLGGICLGQHHYLEDFLHRVWCPTCDDRFSSFPGCLYDNHHTCSSHYKCLFQYSRVGTSPKTYKIQCVHENSCVEPSLAPTQCPYGGMDANSGLCQVCCSASSCSTDLLHEFQNQVMRSPGLWCPATCRNGRLEDCVQHRNYCNDDYFCEVSRNSTHTSGHCRPQIFKYSCEQSKQLHPCDSQSSAIYCNMACCETNTCLQPHFQHFNQSSITTQRPITTTPTPRTTETPTTTTTTTTTTPAPTTSSSPVTVTPSFFQTFETTCEDQLEPGACTAFQASQHICQDRYSLHLCAETCGVCQAIRDLNCHDTVLNDGCATMNDICQQPTAKYLCPKTCGICDSKVEAIVMDILYGKTTTTVTVTTSRIPMPSLSTPQMNTF